MIHSISVFQSTCTDPYYNIATEKYLLENVKKGQCILYLWQNKNTVVIGRNQNAWAECRTSLLEQEGGTLSRRLSGGGAVYHDLGNLNFTFIVPTEDYDLDRQLFVIQTACRNLGIDAVRSGRNDLLADGKKFSGNAFYHSKGQSYHHGTLLVDVDMEKLSRYLSPPKAKLEAKGVASVRSRVTNLNAFVPSLTCDQLCIQMCNAFAAVYGHTPSTVVLDDAAAAKIAQDRDILASWDWLYGTKLPLSFSCDAYFSWGYIQLQLQVDAGTVAAAKVYSDAMDWSIAENLEQTLTGCRFQTDALQQAIQSINMDVSIINDLCTLISSQEI